MATVQELTNKLENLEPLITKINSLDLEKVRELSESIAEVQRSLAINQNIFYNSLKVRVDGDTLVLDPIDSEHETGLPIFPKVPASDGTYTLKTVIENGRTVISWIPKNNVEA